MQNRNNDRPRLFEWEKLKLFRNFAAMSSVAGGIGALAGIVGGPPAAALGFAIGFSVTFVPFTVIGCGLIYMDHRTAVRQWEAAEEERLQAEKEAEEKAAEKVAEKAGVDRLKENENLPPELTGIVAGYLNTELAEEEHKKTYDKHSSPEQLKEKLKSKQQQDSVDDAKENKTKPGPGSDAG